MEKEMDQRIIDKITEFKGLCIRHGGIHQLDPHNYHFLKKADLLFAEIKDDITTLYGYMIEEVEEGMQNAKDHYRTID